MGRRILVRWDLNVGPDSYDLVVQLPPGNTFTKALSDYIANYPNHLEDGLLPHPNSNIRERVFQDRTRLDVLLIDRANNPVIVECKQHTPTDQDIKQLRRYMMLPREETGQVPRGILVHGGASKLSAELAVEARREPSVEIVCYTLGVTFKASLAGAP